MKTGRFEGVSLILRLNWPFYLLSVIVLLAWPAFVSVRMAAASIVPAGWVLWGVTLWWAAASIAASHWVYDRSRLHNWVWVKELLPGMPRRWMNIHAGLDQSTSALKSLLPGFGASFDVFDGKRMTEPAIRRARRLYDCEALPAAHSALPIQNGRMDAVFLLFAAHEFRTRSSRDELFSEIMRVLAPGGRLIVAEHQRDAVNVAAFGPGAWHFLPRSEWLRLFGNGYQIDAEITITPLVHVWSISKADRCTSPALRHADDEMGSSAAGPKPGCAPKSGGLPG